MHVLEAAFAVMGRAQIQELGHAPVPVAWKLRHGQIPLQQGELEFITQHDVQAVADFVGLNPNHSRFEGIEAAPEALAVAPGAGGARARPAQPRIRKAPSCGDRGLQALGKGLTPPHSAFPEQALALVHPHGGGIPQGPREVVVAAARQSLLIEGMAPFMGRGQQG